MGVAHGLWRLARRAALALSIASVATCASACGGPSLRKETASLAIAAQPANAVVHVDGRFVGSARALAVRRVPLRPGRHFVTISAPDWFPHDLMLDLPAGETKVRVVLRAVPP